MKAHSCLKSVREKAFFNALEWLVSRNAKTDFTESSAESPKSSMNDAIRGLVSHLQSPQFCLIERSR